MKAPESLTWSMKNSSDSEKPRPKQISTRPAESAAKLASWNESELLNWNSSFGVSCEPTGSKRNELGYARLLAGKQLDPNSLSLKSKCKSHTLRVSTGDVPERRCSQSN